MPKKLQMVELSELPELASAQKAPILESLLGSGLLHVACGVILIAFLKAFSAGSLEPFAQDTSGISVSFAAVPNQDVDEDLIEEKRILPFPPESSVTHIFRSDPSQHSPIRTTPLAMRSEYLLSSAIPRSLEEAPVPLTHLTVEETIDGREAGYSFPKPPPPKKTTPAPQKLVGTSSKKAVPTKLPTGASKRKSGTGQSKTKSKGISRAVRLKYRPSPRYPSLARRSGAQGFVTVEVTVNTAGRVSATRVVRSSGNRSLDAEATRCARGASFYPAMKNGTPYVSRARIPFSFRLQ